MQCHDDPTVAVAADLTCQLMQRRRLYLLAVGNAFIPDLFNTLGGFGVLSQLQ